MLGIIADSRRIAVPVAALLAASVFTSWMPWPTLAAAGTEFTYHDKNTLIPANTWALLPIVAGVAVALSSRPRRGITVLEAWRLATLTGVAILAPLLVSQVAISIYVAGNHQSPWPIAALVGVVPAVVFGVLGWWRLRHRTSAAPEPTERLDRVTA